MKDKYSPSPRKKSLVGIQILVLVILIFISYIPSLSGEFILDDHPYVKENAFIKEFRGLVASLSQEDGIGYQPAGEYHSGYYRPLINLSYTLDYKLWGMSPGGFRLSNLILHLLTCLVLFHFLRFLLGEGQGPFWAALLFGLHPANTESVAWVVSRNNILVTLFSLAALYFYMRKVQRGKRWDMYLALLFFSAGLLSKEFAVMLVPVFFLYHRLLDENKTPPREELLQYAAFGVIIVAYLILRKNATQSFVTPGETADHLLRGLIFSPWLILYNLRIILFPFGLHYFKTGYPDDLLSFQSGMGFVGMVVLGVLLWRWKNNKHLIFGFLSFMIALFPVLNIIPNAAISLVSMRWLYFPMAFLAISGAWALNRIPAPARATLLPAIIPGALALFLGAYTLVLNQNLWKDEKTFFTQEVFGFQNESYLTDLAKVYHLEGDHNKAYRLFQRALENEKDRPRHKSGLYLGYAALLLDMERPREALHYLDKAEGLRDAWKNRSGIDANRGVAHFKMKNFRAAIRSFNKAIRNEPKNPGILGNLGNAYMATGRYKKAISLYRKSLERDPDRVSTRKMLGIAYLKIEDYQQAIEAFESLSMNVLQKSPKIEKMLLEAKRKVSSDHRDQDADEGGARTSHAE